MKYLRQLKDFWLSRSEKVRSITYLVPLFVFFLPGILLDSGRSYKAAIRGFSLSLLFFGVVFLTYMIHYYIWKQSFDGRYFRDLFFFSVHIATVIAYVGLSGMLMLAESKDSPTPDFWLDQVSQKVVRFLEFKA
ncbi:MAG: hypothetical protein CMF59_17055 [Leptospiraceae bacterium]|nr:hypothetical protein [Leptospiraceae bacterium]